MQRPVDKSFFILVVIWSAIVICSIVNALQRPALPYFLVNPQKPVMLLPSGAAYHISVVDGIPVKHFSFIQMAVETKKIGQSVTLETDKGHVLHVQLIPYGKSWQMAMNLIPALFFLLVALWIKRSRPKKPEAYFIWSGYLFGLIIAISWDGIGHPLWGWPALMAFYLAYPLAFVMFLIYSFYFPAPFLPEHTLAKIKMALITLALIIGMALLSLGSWRYLKPGFDSFYWYLNFYRGFRIFTFITLLWAFINLVLNFKRSRDRISHLRFYWVAGGLILGSFPFVFLWSLPQALNWPPLIPEWASDLSLVIIPFSVAIAILKYRLFDIEIVLSRSLTYLISVFFLLLGYVFLVGSLSLIISQNISFTSPYLSAVAAIAVGLSFNPLRLQVQQFINKKLFHIRYDQFRILQKFLDEINQCSSAEQVGKLLQHNLQKILVLEKNVFIPCDTCTDEGEHIKKPALLLNQKYLSYFEVQLGRAVDFLPADVALMVCLSPDWCWELGKKQSGTRFWREDLELIQEFAKAAAVVLEKIKFWQKALQEASEKEAARQLSSWKSLLVSEVAHNFNGPLNSLIWQLNSLTKKESFQEKKDALQQQILRLQNFVHSLLNLANVESGQLKVNFQILPLLEIVLKVKEALQWLGNEKQIQIITDLPETLMIKGDPVLAESIIQNVLENALKYSPPKTKVYISANIYRLSTQTMVRMAVCDQGPGISASAKANVFKPFEKDQKNEQTGLHLGLYMAQQFAQAMDGKIEIFAAEEGKGTCVEIYFKNGSTVK